MNNTTIVKILKTFSKKEMKDFEKFVGSPYFNTSEATTKLYKELKGFHPSFDGKNCTKEMIFKKIYGGENYNEMLMRKLTSNLLQLSEEFLIAEEGKSKIAENNLRILTQYLKRKLNGQFDNKFSKGLEYLLNKPKHEEDFFYLHILYSLLAHNYSTKSEYRKSFTAVNTACEYLLLYTQLNFANCIAVINDFRYELKIKDDNIYNDLVFNFIETPELIKFIKNSFPENSELLDMYLTHMHISKHPNEEDFFKLKELTFKIIHSLEHGRKRNFMVSLNNQYNRFEKKSEYQGNIKMEILELELKENLLSYYGSSIHLGDFTNKLHIFLDAGEIKRAEEFNDTYSQKLDIKLRKSGQNYGFALVLYHQGNYKESIGFLAKTEHRAFPLNYYVRRLLIQNYIELKDIENILVCIDSTKHFLSENSEVNSIVKLSYFKFLNYCKCLADYFLNKDKSFLKSVLTELNDETLVNTKRWLKQKFEEYLSE